MRSTIAAIAAVFVMSGPVLAIPMTDAERQQQARVLIAEGNYQQALLYQLSANQELLWGPYRTWSFPFRLAIGYEWCKALRSGKSFKQIAQRIESKVSPTESTAMQMAGVVATQYLCPEQNEKVWYR